MFSRSKIRGEPAQKKKREQPVRQEENQKCVVSEIHKKKVFPEGGSDQRGLSESQVGHRQEHGLFLHCQSTCGQTQDRLFGHGEMKQFSQTYSDAHGYLYLEVLLQLKFNLPKGNASLPFHAQFLLPLWLCSVYKHISTLSVTKASTVGVQTTIIIPDFSSPCSIGQLQHPAGVSLLSILYSSSLQHQCPLILTISYGNYCKKPSISLAFCSSQPQLRYTIRVTFPKCFFDYFTT